MHFPVKAGKVRHRETFSFVPAFATHGAPRKDTSPYNTTHGCNMRHIGCTPGLLLFPRLSSPSLFRAFLLALQFFSLFFCSVLTNPILSCIIEIHTGGALLSAAPATLSYKKEVSLSMPHSHPTEDLLRSLDVSSDVGLSDDEVLRRRAKYGENRLQGKKKKSRLD